MPKIRLQVFLSHNGVCSRRKALDLIKDGHVAVNQKTIKEPSTQVDPEKDSIAVRGQLVKVKTYDYVALNKPSGVVTTKADRFAKKTVFDLLPKKFHHLSPVGRLDKDSEGLLLLTNDGDVAFQLTHPKFNVDKTYFVKINGSLSTSECRQLEKGVVIEGKKTAPAKVKNIQLLKSHAQFQMIIHEGQKRQIRLMLRQVGHHVVYLKRLVQGPIDIGRLKSGQWRILTKKEIGSLKNLVNKK